MGGEDFEDDSVKGNAFIGAIAGPEVRDATTKEHEMSLLDSLKMYPAATGWSLFFSMGVIVRRYAYHTPVSNGSWL